MPAHREHLRRRSNGLLRGAWLHGLRLASLSSQCSILRPENSPVSANGAFISSSVRSPLNGDPRPFFRSEEAVTTHVLDMGAELSQKAQPTLTQRWSRAGGTVVMRKSASGRRDESP